MPASTLSSSPQRVMARNLSASSVSSETLMRLTPSAASSARVFRELRAVGGERELLERAALQMARQRGDQRHDAAPHQRLAAGQPQLAHAARDEGAAQAVEFLEREQVGLRQERHVLRHAVDAAEIAAVGHRDAQIGDLAGRTDRPARCRDVRRGSRLPRPNCVIRHCRLASRCHCVAAAARSRAAPALPTIWQLWPISTRASSGTRRPLAAGLRARAAAMRLAATARRSAGGQG